MFASTARADTISHYTFGNTAQSVTLTSNGSGGFTAALGSLSGTTYTLSQATPYNSVNTEIGEANELSNFTITSTSLVSFAANNGSGVFAATGTSSLLITDQEPAGTDTGETFSGTITWNYMKDGTVRPTLVGMATIGAVNYVIDLQLNSIGTQTLGTWAAGNNDAVSATISSGELDMAPEPMSMLLMMFGFAMIGLVAIRRRPALANRLA